MDRTSLTEGVEVRIQPPVLVKQGGDVWRVVASFISNIPEKDKLIKEYYIWVTGKYLEDKARLSANIESVTKFALQLAQQRFRDSGDQVPVEDGISCSLEEGIVIVNPKTFVHPVEQK